MLFRERRRRPHGLADLLNWAALVDEGVVLNKDGSFLAGWGYRGPDLQSATPEEVAALAEQLNRAFLPLGSDWLVAIDAIRAPGPGYPPANGGFPDPVTALIDDERRRTYTVNRYNFETRYLLTLTWVPPAEFEARAARWLVAGRERLSVDWHQVLAAFYRALDDVEDLLSSRLQSQRLDSAALLGHLHSCLTGRDHPIVPPDPPFFLDALLASEDFRGGFEPRIGSRHIAPIAVTGLPLASEPGLLGFLDRLALPFRWSSRWLPLDPQVAERHVRRYRMKWFQKRRGLADYLRQLQTKSREEASTGDGFVNRDATAMADDADRALGKASTGEVRFGYYTPLVMLMDEDAERLAGGVRRVLKEIRNRGFAARLETVNAVEAYLGSLPGHGHPNIRRPLLHSRNFVDLIPATAVWPGHEHCPSPHFPQGSPALLWAATGTTPFRLNLHVSDVGHTLVIGPTGSGKSTLLGLLMAQFFRYTEGQVFAFDKGGSALPLVAAAGGEHYEIAAPGAEALAFCPLARIDDAHERAWAADWLEVLLTLQGLAVGPAVRSEIHRALELLALHDHRTLTTFSLRIQSAEVREALRPYTLAGPLGALLDAERDALRTARFQVFEVSHLMDLGEKSLVPLLLYLFHRIENRLDGRPTLIVLDEAWTFLLHGLFAERIRRWLKELRKANAAVVFATQSLADLRQSAERHVIYESCPTRILLPNAEARSDHGAPLYREIGLNRRELEILARATPKREYYFVSPDGRRLIDLDLGPFALAFLGAGDKDSLARVRELVREHGEGWVAVWLRERGLDEWGARFSSQPVAPSRVSPQPKEAFA